MEFSAFLGELKAACPIACKIVIKISDGQRYPEATWFYEVKGKQLYRSIDLDPSEIAGVGALNWLERQAIRMQQHIAHHQAESPNASHQTAGGTDAE